MDSQNNKKNSRRFFLKTTALGLFTLSIAQFLPLGCASRRVDDFSIEGLQFLSQDEAYLLDLAIRRILYGHNVSDLEIPEIISRLDDFLYRSYSEDQSQFRQLLTVFNNRIFVFLFHGKWKSFDVMSADEQDDYIRGWMTSTYNFRRAGFQALKRLIKAVHYSREASWDGIAYFGPLL